MPQWGNTPLTCLRCTRRHFSTGRPILPGHSASGIRIATPRIPARRFENEPPVKPLLIQRHLRQLQRSQPRRRVLAPRDDYLTPDDIAAAAEAHTIEVAANRQQELEAKQNREKDTKKKRKPAHLNSDPPTEEQEQKKQKPTPATLTDPETTQEKQPKPRHKTGGSSLATQLAQVHPAFPRPHEPHRYMSTIPPTDAQLERARAFFARGGGRFVFTCESFRKFPADSPAPEVAFLGRSNVGKSSLLNVLFGRRALGTQDNADQGTAKVSKRPGKTRTMNVFLVGEGAEGGVKAPATDMHGRRVKGVDQVRWIGPGRAVAVVDMPGHGFGSRAEWGNEIVKYLTQRKQLRRAFVLVSSEHGLKPSDRQVLDILARNGVPHQVVLSKADKLLLPKAKDNSMGVVQKGLSNLRDVQDAVVKEFQLREREKKGTPALGEILTVSSNKGMSDGEGASRADKIGINGLRWAILQAAGLEQPWE
ncbi:gtp binding protein [Diplodia corticola]|uniref:Gtp binding protein n=1 Tax=Diplodia corticola TaxID=236234 RepID=A0A1J9RIP6_9PEZI|nr:gtp binding protein [Diplodia corticola]OJD40520.1 gtp binding protein [Diplodia corticola]